MLTALQDAHTQRRLECLGMFADGRGVCTSGFGLARRSERTASGGSDFDRGGGGNRRLSVAKFTRSKPACWPWQTTGAQTRAFALHTPLHLCLCFWPSAIGSLEAIVDAVCPTRAAPSLRAHVSRHLHMLPLCCWARAPLPLPGTDIAGAIRRPPANRWRYSDCASSCQHHETLCRDVSCSQVNRFSRPAGRVVSWVLDVHCSRSPLLRLPCSSPSMARCSLDPPPSPGTD